MVETDEKTCMIIVNDDYTCNKLSEIFQGINFNVIIVKSGEEAMNKAKSVPFNLAFIGSNLPDMNYLVLIDNLKKKYPDRIYIIISEDSPVQNEINILKAGIDYYFINTWDIEDLVRKAKELLQNQHLQRKLKESEEKFRKIAEQTFIGIAIVQDNRLVYCNQAVSDINGFSVEEMLNWTTNDILLMIYEDYHDIVLNYLEQFQGDPKNPVSEIEFPFNTKNNESKWIRANLKTIIYQNKNALLITLIDITEKKQSEFALKESEEKFKYLVASSPAIIYTSKASGDFGATFVSQNVETLTGYNSEDFTKDSKFWLNQIHPEDRQRVIKGLFDIYTKKEYSHEYRFKFKDGTYHWMLDECVLVENKNKDYDEIIGSWIDITERKETEIALKESEEKFKKITEYTFIGIGIVQNNRLVYCNQAFSDINGYSVDEMLNWTVNDALQLVSEENRELLLNYVNDYQSDPDKPVSEIEFVSYTKNGEPKWIRGNFKTISFQGKNALLATLIDITEKKKAELALRDSEEKFREITEQTSIGVAILQDNKIIYSNKAHSDITGYSLEEILAWGGNHLLKPIHTDYRESVLKFINEYQHDIEQPASEIELPFYSKEKELRWILLKRKTIIYQQRYAILVVTIDITEKKQSELALIESEQNFREIAEQTLVGFAIIQNYKIVYSNKAHSDITGYSLEEILSWDGKELLEPVHENYRDLVSNYITKFQNSKEQLSSEVEFQYYTKKKKLKWVHVHIQTIFYKHQRAILVALIDITKQKEVEQIIKKKVQKLKELDELRNEFIDRASHELKTPLNSIYSASSLFINLFQNELNHKQLRLIKIIDNGAKRLEKLIKNLLDSSRLDIGELKLNIKRVNLIDLLKESIDEFYHMILERKIVLKKEFPKEAYLECDKLRIQEVLNNILSNALKNTPPKGQVLIKLNKNIVDVEIIFSDTGVGFTEQEKKKIFKKFGKIERYGKGMDINSEGSGLGLFISKEIVDLHKGDIRIESEGRNKGCTITVKLPIKFSSE